MGYQNINIIRDLTTMFNLLYFSIYKLTKHRHTVEIHTVNTHTAISKIMDSFR